MQVIGITGGTGSGKTTALGVLESMGVRVIDCDDVYHELLETNKELISAIEERFNGVCIDGVLDRKKLGSKVFTDPKLLAELSVITHKFVSLEVERILDWEEKEGHSAVAIDAIALIESGLSKLCSPIIGIYAPEEIRIKRIMDREGVSREYARLRIRAQKPESWFNENCDLIINNDGSIDEFEKLCRERFVALLEEEKSNGHF